ncbi:hypothetical protein BH11ARM2_BH11ARM2_24510 [soil metagenome]
MGWGSRGGSDVDLDLYHNSMKDDDGPFGRGWTFTYSTSVGASGSTAVVSMPDGLAVQFTKSGSVWVRPAGYFGALVQNVGGDWTLTMRDQSVMRFDSSGRITSVEDRFAYDPLGRLTGVTNPGGSGRTLGYDGEGRRTSRQDEIGRTTYQSYDDAGRPLVSTDGNGDAQTSHYTTAGFLDTITDGNSHTRTYTRTVRGEPATLTLADGTYEQWSHNGNGDITARIDPLSRTTGYTFDDAGQLTAIDRPVSTDVSFSYDNAGRETAMVDGTGTTAWTFDNADRLTTLDQPNGKQTYGYNNAGQRTSMAEYSGSTLLGTTTYSYGSTTGRLDSLANRFSQTTSYAYDSLGRLSVRTLPNGSYATKTYDARSRVATVISRKPDTTTIRSHTYGYDDASQITSDRIDTITTSYGYDGAGQLTSESRTGYSASYDYDHNHNRTSRTVGSTTHDYAYDAGDKPRR